MKTILILAVIIECILLILLTVFKKWTKKAFVAVSAFTALCCVCVGVFGICGQVLEGAVDQREYLYMAARLIEEEYAGETLEVLSVVSDETCGRYDGRPVRALSYNLNEAYRAAEEYIRAGDVGELEELVLEASMKEEAVGPEERRRITSAALEAVAATESEARRWEAEMKVRFMGFHLSEEEKEEAASVPALVKTAIMENRYEDAYNQLISSPDSGSVKNAVIISGMYVKNYNRRTMSDTDIEYAQLWNEAARLQADLNMASLTLRKTDELDEEAYENAGREYQMVKAEYDLALSAISQESVKRAINYLVSVGSDDPEFEVGYQLQLARLYFMSNQLDEARECVYNVFTSENLNDSRWLGRDAATFRDAFIRYISHSTDDEYSVLFDKLMASLYQSVFDDDNFDAFKEFVMSYLREIFGGLIIRRVDTSDFPRIVAEISTTRSGLEVSKKTVLLTDTNQNIRDFSVDVVEVNDLSLSLVLDRSGSMEGNKLIESKNAIRNCVAQMEDSVSMSFVIFDNTASLECGLTDSKYLVMNIVEGVWTTGGTNISSGLTTAIDSLRASAGTKVIILLSDGMDFDDSKNLIDGVLSDAAANDITIYTVGLQGCDEDYLQKIANQTGGQFIMVTNSAELDRTYRDIQNAMMNNYRLTYTVDGEESSRSVAVREKRSCAEARLNYSLTDKDNSDYYYEGGLQRADYYKQVGGTELGR